MKKAFLRKNIWLKLASFILAIALWFFVVLSGRSGIFMDIPLMYINAPHEFEVVDFPRTVSVNIEGQERLIKSLKQNEINAVIDLSKTREGKSFYKITNENIKLPKTLEVTSIEPQTIGITIEKHLRKTVAVQPAVVGVPERGFVIYEIKVVPETVVIEGPKSIISQINNIKTEPVDIAGLNRSLQYKVKLNMSNSSVKTDEQKVDVNIFVNRIK
jgi:YbbR domain-containing protein